METGTIFDISHYMIEDGPGIRTNVFVKGCPLRCKWCSNAFGLEKGLQLSYQVEKCVGCGACINICPKAAVRLADGKAVQDFEACKNCLPDEKGSYPCMDVCPASARKKIGKEMTTDEVIDEVLKDQIFYRRGGGGMTVSGGEILMQPAFVKELLEKGEANYLSNAIETSGMGRWEDLKEMICLCDVVFMDIKCIDAEKHKELTGVDNALIISNIRNAAAECKEKGKVFVLRIPLIPGCNDDEDNLIKTAQFANELGVELNVLPYHNYGADKYKRIGKDYQLSDVKPNSKEHLVKVKQLLEARGADVTMGGYSVESYE